MVCVHVHMYRTYFKKLGEKYPSVVSMPQKMSFSCGRSIPDSLVDDKFRNNVVFLPVDMETRHHLHQVRHTGTMSCLRVS